MALTKGRIAAALSALYLGLLTLLSAYTMHTTRLHSLPIPTTLSAFILALPSITGLTISSITSLPSSSRPLLRHPTNEQNPQQPRWQTFALLTLTILSTVLATLTGTKIAPADGLTCGLDTHWRDMFRQHNGKSIQRIQDAFGCCGLHSVLDMAFPFPAKNVGADACTKTFGRTRNCFGDWRSEERKVGVLMLVVVVGVVLWKVLILLLVKSGGESWWSSVVNEGHDAENQVNGRRALSFGDSGDRGRYLDQPPTAMEEEIDESQDGRNEDAVFVQSRVQPSQLRDESAHWASERGE